MPVDRGDADAQVARWGVNGGQQAAEAEVRVCCNEKTECQWPSGLGYRDLSKPSCPKTVSGRSSSDCYEGHTNLVKSQISLKNKKMTKATAAAHLFIRSSRWFQVFKLAQFSVTMIDSDNLLTLMLLLLRRSAEIRSQYFYSCYYGNAAAWGGTPCSMSRTKDPVRPKRDLKSPFAEFAALVDNIISTAYCTLIWQFL